MAALARARGHQMRDIVATIQSEQDEAIRAPCQGFTMISGGPGTGKTVVALHRAAYLLYSNRRRFESGGVLVVGPSRVFMNYIERVLPSLGEDAVTLRSIGAVAADVVRHHRRPGRRRRGRGDQGQPADGRGARSGWSTSRRRTCRSSCGSTLKGARARCCRPPSWRGSGPTCWRTTSSTRAGRRGARPCSTRCGATGPASSTWSGTSSTNVVSDSAAFAMFGNAWWPAVSATGALARLADVGACAPRLAAGHAVQRRRAELLSASSAATGGQPDWTVADGALLDELVHLLGPVPRAEDARGRRCSSSDDSRDDRGGHHHGPAGPRRGRSTRSRPRTTTYAHILVDEAQDITPMQWRMLRRRGPQRELDHRRRPGAELLARSGARPSGP